jgi:hypothetical protein
VFVEDLLSIHELSEEVICETAAEDLLITLRGEGRFEDSVNGGLDFRGAFI